MVWLRISSVPVLVTVQMTLWGWWRLAADVTSFKQWERRIRILEGETLMDL